MKKRAKAIISFAFLGGIMVTSTVMIAIPGAPPSELDGAPNTQSAADADYDPSENYMEDERARYCGTGQPPGSTDYVREFEIPTACTNPLAIAVDYDGNPWFAESNTGRAAMFDPDTETFTEYPNPDWPVGATSTMWGMDHAANELVWFTDDWSDSLWALNTATGQYGRIPFPKVVEDPLPQRVLAEGSQVIVNDFHGNMLAFLDPNQPDSYLLAPSPVDGSVTSSFVDDGATGSLWYTSWSFIEGSGYLVEFDYDQYAYDAATTNQVYLPPIDYVGLVELPSAVKAPNGITISGNGKIWIADTSSSSLFEFDPATGVFAQYPTADPAPSAYGNKTGIIKSPISRPYWAATDDLGRVVFNAQTSNSLSVLDPVQQNLVEYYVPSKNPYWTDCMEPVGNGMDAAPAGVAGEGGLEVAAADNCGIAQVLDFDVYQDKIWFTEWVENKIGVVDTSVPLPFDVDLPDGHVIQASPGRTHAAGFGIVDAASEAAVAQFRPFAVSASEYVSVSLASEPPPGAGYYAYDVVPAFHEAVISISDDAPRGIYKILLGAQSPDVSVGKFVTAIVP